MMRSQNGYGVIQQADDTRLHRWIIPGCTRQFTLRAGPTGFILAHFLTWFHDEIEALDEGTYDDWGYAYRQVRDAEDMSNHASGTAVDVNATLHPMGRSGTFNGPQVIAMRRRLRLVYLGTIRWGGMYEGRVDEMHFEIHKPIHRCARIARILLRTPRGKKLAEANPGQARIITNS